MSPETGNKALDESLFLMRRFYCLGLTYIIAYKIGEDMRGKVNFKELFPNEEFRLAAKRILQYGFEMEKALGTFNGFYLDKASETLGDSLNEKGEDFYRIITEIVDKDLDGASIKEIYKSIHEHLLNDSAEKEEKK